MLEYDLLTSRFPMARWRREVDGGKNGKHGMPVKVSSDESFEIPGSWCRERQCPAHSSNAATSTVHVGDGI